MVLLSSAVLAAPDVFGTTELSICPWLDIRTGKGKGTWVTVWSVPAPACPSLLSTWSLVGWTFPSGFNGMLMGATVRWSKQMINLMFRGAGQSRVLHWRSHTALALLPWHWLELWSQAVLCF